MLMADVLTLVNRVAGLSKVYCPSEKDGIYHFIINDTTLLLVARFGTQDFGFAHYYPTTVIDDSLRYTYFDDAHRAIKEAAEHTFDVTAANGRTMRFGWMYNDDFTEKTLWFFRFDGKDKWIKANDELVKLFEDNRDIAMDYIEENY